MTPASLTSFLNMPVLASHPGLVSEVLLRASSEIPSLRAAALAANVIAGLDTGHVPKSAALFSLLHSVPFRDPLSSYPADRYPSVFRVLQLPGPSASLSLDDALLELSREIFGLEASWLRPVLASVVQAGGLGRSALAIERLVLGTSDEDYGAAKAELRRLERGAAQFLAGWQKVRDIEVPGTEGFRVRAGDLTAPQRRRMKFLAGLGAYFGREFPSTNFPKGRHPAHWTDYLLRREGRSPGDGSCSPRHGLFAHLAATAGVDLQPVFYPQHVNAYDAEVDLVFDAASLPYFSTLDEWRACRFLGSGEGAAPTYAFLWSVIVNLGGEGESAFLNAAAQIHEGSAHHLAYLALANYEKPEGRIFAERAIERNPLHPLPHAILARSFAAGERVSEAVEAFERAESLLSQDPHPKAPTGIVADLGISDIAGFGRHVVAFLLQGRHFAEASRVLEALLRLQPDDTESMFHLGTVAYWIWLETAEDERPASLLEKAEALLSGAIEGAPTGSSFLADARRNLRTVKAAYRK